MATAHHITEETGWKHPNWGTNEAILWRLAEISNYVTLQRKAQYSNHFFQIHRFLWKIDYPLAHFRAFLAALVSIWGKICTTTSWQFVNASQNSTQSCLQYLSLVSVNILIEIKTNPVQMRLWFFCFQRSCDLETSPQWFVRQDFCWVFFYRYTLNTSVIFCFILVSLTYIL